MPELPEVEAVRVQLCDLVGWEIVDGTDSGAVRFVGAGSVRGTIVAVTRRGKWLSLQLDPPDPSDADELVVHLGMTGQLRRRAQHSSDTHVHVALCLTATDGRTAVLELRDPRRFGRAVARRARRPTLGFDELGPEVTDRAAVAARLRQLATSRRPVKAALLDQRVVAGAGNIYCDEALFAARIAPSTPCCDLDQDAVEALAGALAAVVAAAVAAGGTTVRDYRHMDDTQGAYQERLLVYGRFGRPCPRCGAALSTGRVAGRTSTWCQACTPPVTVPPGPSPLDPPPA